MKNQKPVTNSFVRQAGVGIIEVLVSVLILSIGLLGVAWVQTQALANNSSAAANSMATVAAYTILDAMRSDLESAQDGNYNGKVTAGDCPSGNSLVEVHLGDWCNLMALTMGAADTTTGAVECDANGVCTITISYDDSRIGEGGGEQILVTKAQL